MKNVYKQCHTKDDIFNTKRENTRKSQYHVTLFKQLSGITFQRISLNQKFWARHFIKHIASKGMFSNLKFHNYEIENHGTTATKVSKQFS